MGYSIKAYLSETRMARKQVFFTHNLSIYTHTPEKKTFWQARNEFFSLPT